ncbi:hypothetical protein VULLAG_LOCUS5063 [Vulpes lagopus]
MEGVRGWVKVLERASYGTSERAAQVTGTRNLDRADGERQSDSPGPPTSSSVGTPAPPPPRLVRLCNCPRGQDSLEWATPVVAAEASLTGAGSLAREGHADPACNRELRDRVRIYVGCVREEQAPRRRRPRRARTGPGGQRSGEKARGQ